MEKWLDKGKGVRGSKYVGKLIEDKGLFSKGLWRLITVLTFHLHAHTPP